MVLPPTAAAKFTPDWPTRMSLCGRRSDTPSWRAHERPGSAQIVVCCRRRRCFRQACGSIIALMHRAGGEAAVRRLLRLGKGMRDAPFLIRAAGELDAALEFDDVQERRVGRDRVGDFDRTRQPLGTSINRRLGAIASAGGGHRATGGGKRHCRAHHVCGTSRRSTGCRASRWRAEVHDIPRGKHR